MKKKVTYREENIVKKEGIACYKQFLLFLIFHSYISLVHQNAALYCNRLNIMLLCIQNELKLGQRERMREKAVS